MKIHLEQLQHQEAALKAIMEAFPPVGATLAVARQTEMYANPVMENAGDESLFIDCKMETGTGKTYVYTRLMYELYKKSGLFKFIIVVPSLAIKEGTKNFINSDYARQHFARFYQNTKLELQVINAGDFDAKKGRKSIPSHIATFCETARNEQNTIQCLLISDRGHLDKKNTSLFKTDYDQTLFGSCSCPSEAIRKTRPIVIIDEPHRLKRDGKSYQNIIEKLNPQMIVRFGATFPDYYRGCPQFDLGAVESFNQGLVKAVDISFADLDETSAGKIYTVAEAGAKKAVLTKERREYEVAAGDLLPPDFGGTVAYEGGPDKKLSNDLELHKGMKLIAGTFVNAYQEILINEAVNAHFEKERINFFRDSNRPKVKTVTLFFIDSIQSYRHADGWIRQTFERLLHAKLDKLIAEYGGIARRNDGRFAEYLSFLQATKRSLASETQTVHGGYFARDWGEPDTSAIGDEREDILHKERTLPFKKPGGEWNVRRFFFSKWTLREGWDNPNVFVICKLRTSGSETSKIQEVGRGLRLPVDERGNRLSDEEARLDYIIGWDEKDFARLLVGEINRDAKLTLNREQLSAEMIKIITDCRKISENELLQKLIIEQKIIDFARNYTEGGYDRLLAGYPELLQTQLQRGKVSTNGDTKRPPVQLRPTNWNRIAGFWQQVSRRYMLHFERLPQGEIENLTDEVLKEDIFSVNPVGIVRQSTEKGDDGTVKLVEKRIMAEADTETGQLAYGDFIKKLHGQTLIPVQILHAKIREKLADFVHAKTVEEINKLMNDNSLSRFVSVFQSRFIEAFATKYKYTSLSFNAETSVMKGGGFVKELERGLLGGSDARDIAEDSRNLYDYPLSYDSEIEHEILKIHPPEQVIVYGKLPKKSIKLPTYTGGTTSPDFVYAIRKNNAGDDVALHFVVETKSDNPRLSDRIALETQKKAFEAIGSDIHWQVETDAAAFERDLRKIAKIP
jgi:type III restriction enzyme